MPEPHAHRYAWRDAEGSGRQSLVVIYGEDAITADGRVEPGDDVPEAIEFTVVCDANWRTRGVEMIEPSSGRRLMLIPDGAGGWSSDTGALPALHGAIDVDITATPFTNTLPIRRLSLEVGEHADILTAYVSVPEFTVSADPQRYTRISERVYRFEALDSGFTREITVDELGFVVEYPGLFSRIDASGTGPS
jgi:uncharacterized protein